MTERKPVSITDPKTNRTFRVDPETGKELPPPYNPDESSSNTKMSRQCREIIRGTLAEIVRHDREVEKGKHRMPTRLAWIACAIAVGALALAAAAIGAALHHH